MAMARSVGFYLGIYVLLVFLNAVFSFGTTAIGRCFDADEYSSVS